MTRKKFHQIPSRKQQRQLIICDLNIAIHYLTVVSCFPDRGNAHDFLEVILNTQFLVQFWQDNVTPGCPSALSCGFPASLGLKLISQPAGQLSHWGDGGRNWSKIGHQYLKPLETKTKKKKTLRYNIYFWFLFTKGARQKWHVREAWSTHFSSGLVSKWHSALSYSSVVFFSWRKQICSPSVCPLSKWG